MEHENMISEEIRDAEQAESSKDAAQVDHAVFTASPNAGEFESVYEDTLYFVDGMVEQYDFYPEIIDALGNGSARMELKKRYMLKAINEVLTELMVKDADGESEIDRMLMKHMGLE